MNDVTKFAALAQQFVADANKLPEAAGLTTNINVNFPQLFVHVDREKVKSLGISLTDLFQTQQAMLSTLYVNDFNIYGKTFRVQIEAQPQFRERPEDVGRLYVRGPDAQMIPVSSLVTTEFKGAPNIVTRFNGFTAAVVNGTPAPGKSSGELLKAVRNLADTKYAPLGMGYAFSGQSYEEVQGGTATLVFTMGIIMVFLVLAALYESWSIPFAVLFGVPFGLLGALLGVWIRRMPNDVYFQVGLIVVVGLAAKNAILIVEFANELRAQGLSIREAATEAARERLRPILMTSFAFILGVVPLLVASGAGAQSRHSIGTGVFFGMLFATTVGIFFVPSFFAEIRMLSERGLFRRKGRGGSRCGDLCGGGRLSMPVLRKVAPRLLALLVVAGCAVGPSYKRPQVETAPTWRAPSKSEDSVRSFFDSLANGKNLIAPPTTAPADTLSGAATVRRPDWRASYESRPLDVSTGVSWAELIKDPALQALIDTAVRNNRDVRVAIATIAEFRARVRRGEGVVLSADQRRRECGAREARDRAGPERGVQCHSGHGESAVGARLLGTAAAKQPGRARRLSGERGGTPLRGAHAGERCGDRHICSCASSISISRSRSARSRRGSKRSTSRCAAISRGSSPSSTCASSSPRSTTRP